MALHELKTLFFCNPKAFLLQVVLHKLKKRSFSQPKHCLFEQAILLFSNAANFRNRHRKFPPSHNLLFAKNTAILFLFALTPYAVTPEPRTDSKPFRRRFVRKTGFGSCRRKYLQKYFRQSFESSPGVQRVATLGVFLRYFLHAAKSTNPFPFREVRGFANLEAAHINDKFALTKLNPSQKEIRGFPNLESAHPNNNFPLTKLNPSPLCGDYCPTFCKTQKVGQKNARSRRAAENVRTKKEELAIESNTLILTACCC